MKNILLKLMQKRIRKKCNSFTTCSDGCPLYKNISLCHSINDYNIIKENYKIMFPKKNKTNKKDKIICSGVDGNPMEVLR